MHRLLSFAAVFSVCSGTRYVLLWSFPRVRQPVRKRLDALTYALVLNHYLPIPSNSKLFDRHARMQNLSRQGWLILVIVGLVIPAVIHVLSSPVTVLLLSPLIFLVIVFAFFALNLVLAYLLDAYRQPIASPPPLAGRPLSFSTPAAWQAVLTRSQWAHKPPNSLAPLYPESAAISAALNDILILIVRDFVLSWYRELSSSPPPTWGPSWPPALATLRVTVRRPGMRLYLKPWRFLQARASVQHLQYLLGME